MLMLYLARWSYDHLFLPVSNNIKSGGVSYFLCADTAHLGRVSAHWKLVECSCKTFWVQKYRKEILKSYKLMSMLKGELLEWLICGPGSQQCCPLSERPRMQWRFSPSLVLKSQRIPRGLPVFSLCWNPEEVGSVPQERAWWTIPGKWGQAGKTQKLPSSTSFYVGFHQKVWPRVRVGLPTSNTTIKKTLTGMPSWSQM